MLLRGCEAKQPRDLKTFEDGKEEIGLFRTSMFDFTAKLKTRIKNEENNLGNRSHNQYESELDNTAVDHESPTKT